jgi:hypothetical protein
MNRIVAAIFATVENGNKLCTNRPQDIKKVTGGNAGVYAPGH